DSDGTPRREPADRLNPGTRPPAQGDRRLQGLDAGSLSPLSEVGQQRFESKAGRAGRGSRAEPKRPSRRRILGVNRRGFLPSSTNNGAPWPAGFVSPALSPR